LAAKEKIGRILAIRDDIPREQLTDLAQVHLHNGLYQTTSYLSPPSDFVAPTGGVRSWSDPTQMIIEEGTPFFSPERRIIGRSRAKRRQRAALYELAGYVSSSTRKYNKNTGAPDPLARALGRVRANKGQEGEGSFIEDFRERLNIELPGAIYVAHFGNRDGTTRPPDKEHRSTAEETDDFKRTVKKYNQGLRPLMQSLRSEEWQDCVATDPAPR
jgi:hypothetical protein